MCAFFFFSPNPVLFGGTVLRAQCLYVDYTRTTNVLVQHLLFYIGGGVGGGSSENEIYKQPDRTRSGTERLCVHLAVICCLDNDVYGHASRHNLITINLRAVLLLCAFDNDQIDTSH